MLVVSRDGLYRLLGDALGKLPSPASVVYHWYTNNFNPSADSLISDFHEASGSLVSPLTVPRTIWALARVGNTAVATAPLTPVSVRGALTVYGYYVTPFDDSTVWLWAERAVSAPIVFPSEGGQLRFQPRFGSSNCLPGYFERGYFG